MTKAGLIYLRKAIAWLLRRRWRAAAWCAKAGLRCLGRGALEVWQWAITTL